MNTDMKVCVVMLAAMILLSLVLGSGAQCTYQPPSPCSCFEDDTGFVINCRSKGLTEIPQFNPTSESFSLLTLANNDIGSVGARAFYGTDGQPLRVSRIDLAGNSLSSVDDDAFSGMTSVTELAMHMSGAEFPSAVVRMPQLEVLLIQGLQITQLPPGVLQPLNVLRKLSLSQCHLEQLSATDLATQRDSLEELLLDDNSLPAVPALGSLDRLHTLRLDSNLIKALTANAFSGARNLRHLDLSRNTLNNVHSDAFGGMDTTLQTLNLHLSRLHDVNLLSLRSLRSLQTLTLSNNNGIQLLPDGLFTTMDSLQELQLDNCKLSSIDHNTFKGVEDTLQSLDITSNGLATIPEYTFQEFSALHTLKLASQELTPGLNTFRGLENSLRFLDLGDIAMDSSHLNAVSYLSSLHILILNFNAISSLPDFIFIQLSQLQELELSNNLLTIVHPKAMYGLQDSLQLMDLETNKISTISQCTFRDFTSLETILLGQNPLYCDCHARWMREWLDKYSAIDQKQFFWTCSGPDAHAGRYMRDINAADMLCENGEQIEQCAEFTTPAVTSPPIRNSTDGGGMALHLNATAITDSSLTLLWQVAGGGTVDSFLVVALEVGEDGEDEEPAWQEGVDAAQRNVTVDGLRAGTLYMLCLTAYYQQPDAMHLTDCLNSTTAGSALPATRGPSQLAIILGSVLGVLAFVVLMLIVFFVVRRSTTASHPYDKNNGELPESRAQLPTMGYNSKRFSKPRSTMTSVGSCGEDLERKLDGFTPDERNRILQLLSASTTSMASAGSTRYLDQPRPHRWTGGASAYYNHDAAAEEDHYLEIPQGEDYEYIPADQVTKYDYIPADQVQRLQVNDQPDGGMQLIPPPLPPPHPEMTEPPSLAVVERLSQPPVVYDPPTLTYSKGLSQPMHEQPQAPDSSLWI